MSTEAYRRSVDEHIKLAKHMATMGEGQAHWAKVLSMAAFLGILCVTVATRSRGENDGTICLSLSMLCFASAVITLQPSTSAALAAHARERLRHLEKYPEASYDEVVTQHRARDNADVQRLLTLHDSINGSRAVFFVGVLLLGLALAC